MVMSLPITSVSVCLERLTLQVTPLGYRKGSNGTATKFDAGCKTLILSRQFHHIFKCQFSSHDDNLEDSADNQ